MTLSLPATPSSFPASSDAAADESRVASMGGVVSPDPTGEQLRLMTELGDLSMELARSAQQLAMMAVAHETAAYQAAAAASAPGEAPAPVAAKTASTVLVASYARIANAVRQSVLAEAKITTDAKAAAARQQTAAPERRMSTAERRRLKGLKDEVRRHVEHSIATNASPLEAEGLRFDLDARLDDPEIEAAFSTLTIGQIALNVCRDIEVTPDLTNWPDEMLNVTLAAENGETLPPPPKPAMMRTGMTPSPPVEKFPTGVIGSPGVPPAIEMPQWPSQPPPPPQPTTPAPGPAPQPPRQPEPAPAPAPANVSAHDPLAPFRRPPGSFLAR